MKLAIILRGISYYDNTSIKVSNSPMVDYRECVESLEENLIQPLKTVFEQIDFFLVTYNSPKLIDIFNYFNPIDAIIYPASSILTERVRITPKLMIDCLHVIEPYEEYDHILMTRFDLFYYRPFDLSKVSLDKFNFGWKGERGQCDDSFWMFRRSHIPILKTYLMGENYNGNSCHDFNYKIGLDNSNYISKPLDPDNGYHMPDFWLFSRYLPEFRAGTYKLYDWPPKRKRLAIVLRGIMFYNGKEKVCYSNRPVDYKECYESMQAKLLKPLKTIFSTIDFYIVTYDNDRMAEILEDFKPKDTIINPRSSIMTYRKVITVKIITDAINLIEPRQNDYDNILITRSDLYYYNKPLDLDKIKFDKFNFGWKGPIGQCDDSFWFITPKHIPIIKSYLDMERGRNSNNCHNMNTYIPSEEQNYISADFTYDSNTRTGYGVPDFWFFGRYLYVYDKENKVLHTGDQDCGDLHLF